MSIDTIDTAPLKLTADQEDLVSAIRHEITATLAACNDLLALLQGAEQREFESEAARQRFIFAVGEIALRQSELSLRFASGEAEHPYRFGDGVDHLSTALSDTVDDWLPEVTG